MVNKRYEETSYFQDGDHWTDHEDDCGCEEQFSRYEQNWLMVGKSTKK